MKRYAMGVPIILFATAVILVASGGFAYDDYTDTQCATCHPGFVDRDPLHDSHMTFYTSNNCGMCHPTNPGSKPVNTSVASDATTSSCLGCHGRDYGGTTGQQAAGLRVLHEAAGQSCFGCHPGDPTPAGENVNPPHYGRSDLNLTTACNDGLDNDGDGVRDGADPDCQVPVEPSTWGRVKALYQN